MLPIIRWGLYNGTDYSTRLGYLAGLLRLAPGLGCSLGMLGWDGIYLNWIPVIEKIDSVAAFVK